MHHVPELLAQVTYSVNGQQTTALSGTAATIFLLVYLAIVVLVIAGIWKVFTKAGKAGWLAIIPFVNLYVLIKIAGRSGWWLILFFIPLVNFIAWIIISLDVAARFGRSALFAIGMILLAPIFYPILGFGESQYRPAGVVPQGFTPIFPPQTPPAQY